MRIHPSIRFPMLLGGLLASIGLVFWPVVRGTRQAAQCAGLRETSARSGWQLPAITQNGAVFRPRS